MHYSSYLEHINRPPHRLSADLNQHGCLQQGRDKHELLEREDCTIFKSPILSYVVQKGYRSSTCSQRMSRKLAKSQDEGACPWVTRESCNDTEDHRWDRVCQRARRTRRDISAVDAAKTEVTPCRDEAVSQGVSNRKTERTVTLGKETFPKAMKINKLPFAPRHHLGYKEKEGKLSRRETTLGGSLNFKLLEYEYKLPSDCKL